MRKKFSSGFGTACECRCHKRAGILITVAIVLAHMQEALEDNNLISIWEHQSVE